MIKEVKRINDSSGLSERPSRVKRQFNRSGNGFHENCNTQDKEQQRDDVVKFIIQHKPRDERLQLMSLPGESWSIENRLAEQFKDARFVAFEKDVSTWERAARNMPGNNKTLVQWRFSWGHVDAWKTSKAILYRCDMWRIVSMQERPLNWSSHFRKYSICNSIWIDSFSPLGTGSYLELIRGLCRMDVVSRIAAAFTFVIGRDEPDVGMLMRSLPGGTPIYQRKSMIQCVIESCGKRLRRSSVSTHKSWNVDSSLRLGTVFGLIDSVRIK